MLGRSRIQSAAVAAVMLSLLGIGVAGTPGLASQPAVYVAPSDEPLPFVLLVHGWLATSFDMSALRARLRYDGFSCDSIDFSFLGAVNSVAGYAGELSEAIEIKRAHRKRIVIVAHSMGGLAARYYLQRLRKTDQVKAVITLATPHHGTFSGGILAPGNTPTSEMLPGSEFLEELNSASETVPGVDFHAIWSPTDGVVIPAENAIMCGARNYMVSGIGMTHLGLLVSDTAYRIILGVLRDQELRIAGPQMRDHNDAKKNPVPWLRPPDEWQ